MSGGHTPGRLFYSSVLPRFRGDEVQAYAYYCIVWQASYDPENPNLFCETPDRETMDEAYADARPIAAAPELLEAHLAWEAAEDARNDCTDEEDGCDNEGPWEHCPLCSERFGAAIDLRQAAIAKARGQ